MALKALLRFHLFKFCLLLFLLTQCSYLLRDYFSFATVQKVEVRAKEEMTLPALTYCHSDPKVLKKFFEQLACFQEFTFPRQDLCEKARNLNLVAFTKRRNLFCGTYFTSLAKNTTNNFSVNASESLIIHVMTTGETNTLAVHNSLMPSELVDLFSLGCMASVYINVVNEAILPPPFDTNCRIYDKNSRFKSKWDCKLKCQKKGNVYYSSLNSFNLTKVALSRQEFATGFPKPTIKSKPCQKRCKKDCFTEYYKPRIMFNQLSPEICKRMDYFLTYRLSLFASIAQEFISHLPMMTFELLVAQIGGLVSLWFGVSIADFLKKTARQFRINQYCLIFFCFLICLVQNIQVLNSYLQYKTVTKISVGKSYEKVAFWPSIAIEANSAFLAKINNWKKAKIIFKKHVSYKITFWNKTTIRIENFWMFLFGDFIEFTYIYERKDVKAVNIVLDTKRIIEEFDSPAEFRVMLRESPLSALSIYTLKPETDLIVKISQKSFYSLPPPFDTFCFNYNTKEVPNNEFSRYFLEKYFCYHDFVWDNLGCSDPNKLFFINPEKLKSFIKPIYCHPATLGPMTGVFMKQCNYADPCFDFDYQMKEKVEISNVSEGTARIRLVFEDEFVVVLTAQPQMTSFDLFYEIGSLVGLWLGWSIEGVSRALSFCLKMFFVVLKTLFNRCFRRCRQFLI